MVQWLRLHASAAGDTGSIPEDLTWLVSLAATKASNVPTCLSSGVQLHDPLDCSLPGSSVCVVSQARILSGLPFPPPGELPDLGIKPESSVSPALAGGFFTVPYMDSHFSFLNLCLRRAWLYLLFCLSQESGFQIHISNLLSPTWRLPVTHQLSSCKSLLPTHLFYLTFLLHSVVDFLSSL